MNLRIARKICFNFPALQYTKRQQVEAYRRVAKVFKRQPRGVVVKLLAAMASKVLARMRKA